MPTRIGRVLAVVRMLIGYGKQVAEAVQRRAGQPLLAAGTLPFGTLDPAAILARIACGLRRAAALEARLTGFAARGQDLPLPQPTPPTRPSQAAAISRERKPPAPRPRPANRADPDGLPTAAQIAAEVRRRPVGAVVADICRDLGLLPGQCDRAFWKELSDVITTYGGKLSRWIKVVERRIKHTLTLAQNQHDAPPAASTPHEPPSNAAATGPPRQPGFRTVPA
jgi:hypothetical protein